MKRFVHLYTELDETNKTTGKVDAMARYFREAPPEDAAWALYFLIGRRPRRPVPVTKLWAWAGELAGLPDWLLGESYDAVGDLAETIALILPQSRKGDDANFHDPGPDSQLKVANPEQTRSPDSKIHKSFRSDSLHTWIEERLLPMQGMEEAEQRKIMERSWQELDQAGRLVWNKLITGAFRVGVSQDLVIRALSQVSGLPPTTIAHRLMGQWTPSAGFIEGLVAPDEGDADISRPYPFCLAHPLPGEPSELGDIENWSAEWKWDGIRCQLIRRSGQTFVWSRGEEMVSDRFPEVRDLGDRLPDGTVLDGEIMAWRGEKPLMFANLQRRVGRKEIGKKLLDEVPVVLVAFDILEWRGKDIRKAPLFERRRLLEELVRELIQEGVSERGPAQVRLSPRVNASSWEELAKMRQESRSMNVEGLMLKRIDSPYVVGRKKGYWWKWKIQPYTVDAVLIYAARGSGIRASLYTDYTFGIWKGSELVPFAKAYSGLTDAEIREVDAFVRQNTLEKFGPVRTVKPQLVFELAFEGIQLSNRHKSGIAVRFPRIARWRHDKKPDEADTIDAVRELLHATT